MWHILIKTTAEIVGDVILQVPKMIMFFVFFILIDQTMTQVKISYFKWRLNHEEKKRKSGM